MKKSHTNWKKLRQDDDSGIDYTDSPATTKDFWEKAEVTIPHRKIHISVRFDDDIVQYFK